MPTSTKVRMTSFAPQFLVDDLNRSIAYYQKLGFSFGEPWEGFYAIGHLDGLEVHLKEAPTNQTERRWRRDNEHLDASSGVEGIKAFYQQCVANGVEVIKPLTTTAWGTKDFYVEDPDGYISSALVGVRRGPSDNELQGTRPAPRDGASAAELSVRRLDIEESNDGESHRSGRSGRGFATDFSVLRTHSASSGD